MPHTPALHLHCDPDALNAPNSPLYDCPKNIICTVGDAQAKFVRITHTKHRKLDSQATLLTEREVERLMAGPGPLPRSRTYAPTAASKLRAGVRLTDDHHFVAREDGQALQPRSLTHAFVKFARRHGVQIRLHDLRHSHATHMLAAGVHPKIAQERPFSSLNLPPMLYRDELFHGRIRD
jgi:Phage integrase family